CMGSQGANALQALDIATKDTSPAVKQNVAWALGKLGKAGVLSLQKIVAAESDPLIVRDAANSLGELGKDARPAVQDLVRHIQNAPDADPKKLEMRKSVVSTLAGLVTKDDKSAIEPLKVALKDPEPELRRNALLALCNIGGAAAADAVPLAVQALQNEKE